MCENFSCIIQTGNFATVCAKFSKSFMPRFCSRVSVRRAEWHIAGTQYVASHSEAATAFEVLNGFNGSIFFAFVFFGYDAIVDSIRMKHYRAEVEEKEAEPPSGRCERGEQHENPDRDCAKHPEKTCEFMSFIDVSQAGNDT